MRCRSQKTRALHKYQSKQVSICVHLSIADKDSLCKSLIRKLLIKDELRRLGARAGASDVKTHPFFRQTQWALIRHMKPPMIPHQGRAIDTINFRNVKESASVDIGGPSQTIHAKKMKGVPLDSGLATPGGDLVVDPFEAFNSVTLQHDEDTSTHIIDDSVYPTREGGMEAKKESKKGSNFHLQMPKKR